MIEDVWDKVPSNGLRFLEEIAAKEEIFKYGN